MRLILGYGYSLLNNSYIIFSCRRESLQTQNSSFSVFSWPFSSIWESFLRLKLPLFAGTLGNVVVGCMRCEYLGQFRASLLLIFSGFLSSLPLCGPTLFMFFTPHGHGSCQQVATFCFKKVKTKDINCRNPSHHSHFYICAVDWQAPVQIQQYVD